MQDSPVSCSPPTLRAPLQSALPSHLFELFGIIAVEEGLSAISQPQSAYRDCSWQCNRSNRRSSQEGDQLTPKHVTDQCPL
jgi:hypothetical protein